MSKTKTFSKIAQPYSEALIDLALSSSNLDAIIKDIDTVLALISDSKELEQTLASPLISNDNKKNILTNIFTDKISETSLRFLLLIVDRKRTVLLKEICQQFLELSYVKSGVLIAEVITSVEFTEKQYDLLVQKVQDITQSKKVKLEVSIDPELIGGFTIQLGSKLIDSSLKGKLKQITSHLNVMD
uniref:ATP synthase CF1 delta subunit n=1 Tax=Timspurckia oligopyrenoides TaxID=708627 RepID=UPI001FCD884C|nr:ATP synthase CF1 delta subunit [Timspurckia oligopyrenoides]UNJ17469.1 ATP synthase CF1 delta subunit [Timspurckia oligopyrenoides]